MEIFVMFQGRVTKALLVRRYPDGDIMVRIGDRTVILPSSAEVNHEQES